MSGEPVEIVILSNALNAAEFNIVSSNITDLDWQGQKSRLAAQSSQARVSGPRTARCCSTSLSRAPRRNAAQFGHGDKGAAAGLEIRKVVLSHLEGLEVGTEEKSIFAFAYKKGTGHHKASTEIRTTNTSGRGAPSPRPRPRARSPTRHPVSQRADTSLSAQLRLN